MNVRYHVRPNDPYVELARSLSEALSRFASAIVAEAPSHREPVSAANDNDVREAKWPDDPMTLKEVQFELRLKEAQVVKLRRLWGFPSPAHRNGKYVFSRRQVERWARQQPDPTNLAAALRLRRRKMPSGR